MNNYINQDGPKAAKTQNLFGFISSVENNLFMINDLATRLVSIQDKIQSRELTITAEAATKFSDPLTTEPTVIERLRHLIVFSNKIYDRLNATVLTLEELTD